MAVQLGYKEVYRYPLGFLDWRANGLPSASVPAGTADAMPPVQDAWGLIWTLLGVFLGGVALNLTPCVYPIVPVTVSYFVGRAGAGTGSVLAHGVCYVGGLALMNSLLGVAAALTGGLMGSALQNPAVPAVVAAVLLALAASLFGFWELRLPSWLTRPASRKFGGYFGSLFVGLTMGVVAAPCTGPFVLGLLAWVASRGSVLFGFAVFLTLGLGFGLPLLFLALFSGHLDRLPRAGGWMVWVRRLMGWVLVGMAFHFARALFSPDVELFLLAAVALAAGVDLGWRAQGQGGSRTFTLLRYGTWISGALLALTLVGNRILGGPGLPWQTYTPELLAAARSAGRPVIIVFSASWCTPCRMLEDVTFHNKKVVDLAAAQFAVIKVDLTGSGNSVNERLVREYEIKGVPTIVFIGADGREHRALRLVDYLPADDFLARMEATQISR